MTLLLSVFFAFLLVPSHTALAQGGDPVQGGLEAVGEAGGIAGTGDLITIVGRIINIALGFVGLLLLVYLIYAGFLWMTSGGATEKVDKAKLMIRNAIIGLIIIVSAFAIAQFVMNALLGASTGGGIFGTGAGSRRGYGFPSASGSLGGGIIESHVPSRNAKDVPRNTAIVITFKEPIKISSFIRDYNDNGTPADVSDDPASSTTIGLNNDVIKIYPTGSRDRALGTSQARVRFTADRQTFVIRSEFPLGNATSNTPYTVELVSGSSGLLREDGRPAFSGAFSAGYAWGFEVSTVIDNKPPQVSSVIPRSGGRYAPNVIVQINFNEAIDPTTASGLIVGGSGFTNIELRAVAVSGGSVSIPNGEYQIANQYRTVEFVSDLSCGTNSCGRTVYCLPADSSVNVTVKAATLSDTPPLAAFTASGADGVTDMAGNSLDGNRNGTSEGRDRDDYAWTFATDDAPNLAAPLIRQTEPAAGDFAASSNLALDDEPAAVFDVPLQASTINSSNVVMRTNEPVSLADTFWWSSSQELLNSSGAVAAPSDDALYGRISIAHRTYIPSTPELTPMYQPVFFSGLQNIYQNCFNPASSSNPECAGAPHCCDGRPSEIACSPPR